MFFRNIILITTIVMFGTSLHMQACDIEYCDSRNGVCPQIVAGLICVWGVAGGTGAALGATVLKSETLDMSTSAVIGYFSAVGASTALLCVASWIKVCYDGLCCND